MEDPIVVFVTAPSQEEAVSIGRSLVGEGLVACANLVPGMRSLYMWKGELCDEGEVLMLMKSRRGLLTKIVDRVKALHSYEVPEIIALPIVGGAEDYFRWMEEVLS